MSYEQDALRTTVTVSQNAKLVWLSEFVSRLNEIPEITAVVMLSQRKIDIYVDMETDYYNGRSPHANHSFCHGWIARGIVESIENELLIAGEFEQTELVWEQIKWIPERRQIIKVDDTVPGRSLKKVRLND